MQSVDAGQSENSHAQPVAGERGKGAGKEAKTSPAKDDKPASSLLKQPGSLVSAASQSPSQAPPPLTFAFALPESGGADVDGGADSATGAKPPMSPAFGKGGEQPPAAAASATPASPAQGAPKNGPLAFSARLETPAPPAKQQSQAVQRQAQPEAPETSKTRAQTPLKEPAAAAPGAPEASSASPAPAQPHAAPSSPQTPSVQFGEVSHMVENPAPQVNQTTSTAASALRTTEVDSTKAPEAPHARDFAIRLSGPDQAQATVRVREIAGEVRVSVHTPDTELTKSLRSDLDSLVGRLDSAGMKTQVWHPAQSASAENSTDRQGSETGHPAEGQKNSQPRQNDFNQQKQGRKSRWLEEMEKQNGHQ
jgi:hypothetical protein